jgi:hypothetical protein
MHEDNFFFNPNNTERICHFLKRTRLGFSKGINWDNKLSDKELNEDIVWIRAVIKTKIRIFHGKFLNDVEIE